MASVLRCLLPPYHLLLTASPSGVILDWGNDYDTTKRGVAWKSGSPVSTRLNCTLTATYHNHQINITIPMRPKNPPRMPPTTGAMTPPFELCDCELFPGWPLD